MLPGDSFVLQKEPDWIKSLSGGEVIVLCGDGDAKVEVPAFLLAATSQFVRNILCGGDQLPLAYFTPVISLDSVSGEVLGLVRDFVIKGEAKASDDVQLGHLQASLKMLMIDLKCEIKIDSYVVDFGEVRSTVEVGSKKDFELKTRVGDDICPFCYGIFKTKFSRDRHVNKMHSEIVPAVTKSNHKCPECDKTFNQKLTLDKHMLHCHSDSVSANVEENTSTDVEKSPCTGFEVKPKTYVIRNESTDAEEKECTDVEKNSNEDKHSCQVCQKSFINKTHLLRHMNVHEQVLRKFPCNICSATFARKDSLMKHRTRLHFRGKVDMGIVRESFEKSSVCQICGKDFGSDSEKFQRHFFHKACQNQNKKLGELTDDDKYQCEQCNKSYTDRFCLQRHVSSKHIQKS